MLTREYLGVEAPDDASGVLQDVHWATVSFGYFPTYSLGNVIAGQLWEAARREVPDLEQSLSHGEFAVLGDWLGENVHRWGRRLDAPEIIERATGSPIEVGPYVCHLGHKYSELYGLAIAPG